jgi:HlyD family secretion protein
MSIVFRVVVVLVLLGVGWVMFSTLAGLRQNPESVVEAAAPLPVVTVLVQPIEVPRIWQGFGTVRPMDEADVSAQVTARVIERPEAIEAGNAVRAGAVLARLEAIDFELRAEASRQVIAGIDAEIDALLVDRERLGDQLRLAREQADIAEREYQRFVDAQAGGIANQIELDARLTSLRRAEREVTTVRQSLEQLPSREASLAARRAGEEANLRVALENLSRATITSPIAGVLQEVFVEVGELLPIGAPVARIVSLDRVEVPVRLPVSALGSIGVGDAVRLTPDGPDERSWTGRVSRISPEADERSRTVAVFVEVNQPGASSSDLLRPGRFVSARVTTRRATERVLVPRRAVLDDTVFVAADIDGQDAEGDSNPLVERVQVKVLYNATGSYPSLDPNEEQWAVLESGEALVGRRVITTNLDRLQIGGPVRATDAHRLRDSAASGTGESNGAGS